MKDKVERSRAMETLIAEVLPNIKATDPFVPLDYPNR